MSSEEKKLDIKRLVIFSILSFVPLAAAAFSMWAYYGEPIFSGKEEMRIPTALLGFTMFAPAAANLITRLVTKEGFKDSYLAFNFKGNAKYYAASVWIKIAEPFVTAALIAVFLTDLNLSEAFTVGKDGINIAYILLSVANAVFLFFPGFGEEWGWRGYMMPKLLKLMPKPAAIAVGGVIWGLWHAPLTVQGHNFGLDYPGFPWTGIALMCLHCTLMNALLTYLTERTKSVYPASFCHYVNNCLPAVSVFGTFATEKLAACNINENDPLILVIMFSVDAIAEITAFILFIRPQKKNRV